MSIIKRNWRWKVIAIVMSVCLTFLSAYRTAFSEEYCFSEVQRTETAEGNYTVPDSIDPNEAEMRGYIGREKEDEKDLYTFVFCNADGGYTMRTFTYPVKYISESGETRDIAFGFSKGENGAFVAADHPIRVRFASELTQGIELGVNDVYVQMRIEENDAQQKKASLSADGKKLVYEMDDTTKYVYTLTCCGIKEDIVVSEFTGQSEYKFVLKTNGLHPVSVDGSTYLANQDGVIKVALGDVFVTTADEKNNFFGRLLYETITEDSEYRFIISLDARYLSDAKTKYPITIDPTLEITYANNGTGAIQDVTINQNTTYSGTSGSLYVGRHSDGSLSRVLMRFPNLNLPVKFGPMIRFAQVELRDLMCQGHEDMTIYCYSYSESAPTWTEAGTTTWSSVGSNYVGTLLDSHLVSFGQGNVSSHRYGFDITSLVRQWADGIKSPTKGLVFKASSAFEGQTGNAVQYWYKTFASYNRSSYQPSLSIRYEKQAVFTICNSSNGTKYLAATGTGTGGATFSDNVNLYDGKKLWCIEYLTAYDSVNIVSMGVRYTGGKKAYVVYNTVAGAGLDVQATSSTYKQYKPIYYSGNTYYFKNLSNNRYLCINSSYTALLSSTTQDAKSRLSVSRVSTDTFNNFWSGGYSTGVYSGVAYIKIQIDSSVSSHPLYSGNDFSAAKLWNGITEKVKIYGPNETVPSGITPILVTFKADTSIASNTFAETIPNGYTPSVFDGLDTNQQVSILASQWTSVTIFLNGKTSSIGNPFYQLTGDDRIAQINKVICHEMGHALKLAHPSENNGDGLRHYFSGCRGNYAGQESVYAVMNQGFFNDTVDRRLTAASPQDHDWVNLISKWEYHINCSH